MESFEGELENIFTTLPKEFLFSPRAVEVRAFSSRRTDFIMLHIWWHQCHCDLYRILTPGFREAAKVDVLGSVSNDYSKYCQEKGLEHAIAVGELVLTTYDIVKDVYVSDPSIAVCLYQCSCAILNACHRFAHELRSGLDPTLGLCYLRAFAETLSRLSKLYPSMVAIVREHLVGVSGQSVLHTGHLLYHAFER